MAAARTQLLATSALQTTASLTSPTDSQCRATTVALVPTSKHAIERTKHAKNSCVCYRPSVCVSRSCPLTPLPSARQNSRPVHKISQLYYRQDTKHTTRFISPSLIQNSLSQAHRYSHLLYIASVQHSNSHFGSASNILRC